MIHRLTAALAAVLSVLFMGCSVPPEQPILERFFAASRLRDTTALSTVATILFEPREQGTVLGFDLKTIDPDGLDKKTVTVSALVRLPGGHTARKSLVVTLQRSSAGWIVTAVKDAASSPASPSTPHS